MSTGTRVPYAEARSVASELVERIRPACERLEVAGSIRRHRPDAGDVELVAVPLISPVPGLFEDAGTVNRLWQLVNDLMVARPGEPRTLATHVSDPRMGERYAKLQHPASGLQVDLFTARTHTFGLMLLIRTGPATYSRWFVTEARRRGLHVSKGAELHRGSLGCGSSPCEVIPTPEEADVYRAMGVPFLAPEARG